MDAQLDLVTVCVTRGVQPHAIHHVVEDVTIVARQPVTSLVKILVMELAPVVVLA